MIDGSILIGRRTRRSNRLYAAVYPEDLARSELLFSAAEPEDVVEAGRLAAAAYPPYCAAPPETRGAFLEAVADEIMALGAAMIEVAARETGLGIPRLEGERSRTVNQLRLFARIARRGDWMDAVIERELPDRSPAPRPDLRRLNQALGPIAVFGASNFPLAFSVAGGDTAAALAAGCPVIVKGHPAHPGTGEYVARAVQRAAARLDLPEGVFSYLPGPDHALGEALARAPAIKAVAFTGSRKGGMALAKIAAARREPIPVFAEMSSVNPVILMPAALRNRADALAAGFVQSLTLGAGQFCTNPGLLLAIAGSDLDRFIVQATSGLSACRPAVMLSEGIHAAYVEALARLEAHPAVETLWRGSGEGGGAKAGPALFATDAESFRIHPELADEIFGAAALIVRAGSLGDIEALVRGADGQLTGTVHLDLDDQAAAAPLMLALADRAGRVIANGWPTGVEVCEAMVHGGPTPATSDHGRSSSVGALAIMRFVRPVCYQNMPQALLPKALQDENPWAVPQRRPE